MIVPEAGLEPARHHCLRILSPLCLPFHHSGKEHAKCVEVRARIELAYSSFAENRLTTWPPDRYILLVFTE